MPRKSMATATAEPTITEQAAEVPPVKWPMVYTFSDRAGQLIASICEQSRAGAQRRFRAAYPMESRHMRRLKIDEKEESPLQRLNEDDCTLVLAAIDAAISMRREKMTWQAKKKQPFLAAKEKTAIEALQSVRAVLAAKA